jgi:cytochrome c-type biogenesis protein CcmH/NrfG
MSELSEIAAETYRLSNSIKSDHYSTKIELAIALMNSIGPQTPQEQAQAWGEEAMQVMQEAVALAPRVGRAHFYLGVVMQTAAGSDPQALSGALGEMSLALSLGCQDPMLFPRMAQLYAVTGRVREMIAFAKVHAERNPDDPSAYVFLARASLTDDRREEALAAILHAQTLVPGSSEVLQMVEAFQAEIARRNAADKAPVKAPVLDSDKR